MVDFDTYAKPGTHRLGGLQIWGFGSMAHSNLWGWCDTARNMLYSSNCCDLDKYIDTFWGAYLVFSSYLEVLLSELIEKYCCGLAKERGDFCMKSIVSNLV